MDQIFFISARHRTTEDGGIYTCSLTASGEPSVISSTPLLNSGYLALDRSKKVLYASFGADENSDAAAAFTIEENGSLAPLGKCVTSGGMSSCHIAVSPERNFLYTANYLSGSFTEFRLAPDGSIAAKTRIIRHQGRGLDKTRQEMPHPHCCVFSPDSKFLTVADLGNDTIYSYPFDENNGIDEKNVIQNHLEAGCGPRHILFDRNNLLAYIITELGNSLISFKFDDGKFTLLDELLLLPRGVTCPTKAAALRFSDDQAFIVCSNRGFDSLAVVELDSEGGIFPASLTLSGGSNPRDINFLGKNFFAVANEFANEVRFFDFDDSIGNLTPNGYLLKMPCPRCIIPL